MYGLDEVFHHVQGIEVLFGEGLVVTVRLFQYLDQPRLESCVGKRCIAELSFDNGQRIENVGAGERVVRPGIRFGKKLVAFTAHQFASAPAEA